MTSAPLPLGVASALVAALVQEVAARTTARTLLVKGRVADHFGLRPPRTSADVDVLVEPSRYPQVVAEFAALGWVARPEMEASTVLSAHSASLVHPEWPCDIDVHSFFPGLLAGAETAFDALWNERSIVDGGGIDCSATGITGSVIVAALHSLRHVSDDPRYARELESAAEVVDEWSDSQKRRLGRLAEATGAAGPMAEWLAARGIAVVVQPSPGLEDWFARRESGDTFAGQFVAGMAQAGWRDRWRLAWITVWPREEQLRAAHPEFGASKAAVARERARRWGRGLRDLPRAIRSLRRARRGGHQ
jgi:hypothetical protein